MNQTTFLPLFKSIDELLLTNNRIIICLEGGSASGKSSLALEIKDEYECTLIHMDDFFLRPSQRTKERLNEIGGNIDIERFCDEIITPLLKGEQIYYHKFDCSTQLLSDPITIEPKELIVIEGVYSMHPLLQNIYDLKVFLDISKDLQIERINKRNSPTMAKRFFEEWIPLENKYFNTLNIKEKCDLIIKIKE